MSTYLADQARRDPRCVVASLSDDQVREAQDIAQRIADLRDRPRPLRNPKQARCPHGFVDGGKGRCWECDPEVAQDKEALLVLRQLGDMQGRDRRRTRDG